MDAKWTFEFSTQLHNSLIPLHNFGTPLLTRLEILLTLGRFKDKTSTTLTMDLLVTEILWQFSFGAKSESFRFEPKSVAQEYRMKETKQDFGPKVFDLWIYHRCDGEAKYLIMHTSQEKADKWFGGGRFWQIPGDSYQEGEATAEAIQRNLREFGLKPKSVWCCEYVYTIYNRRFDGIQIIPVFAAEVVEPKTIDLTWEHSEADWLTAKQCLQVINFWGLKEGLNRTREYVTENPNPPKEFQLL